MMILFLFVGIVSYGQNGDNHKDYIKEAQKRLDKSLVAILDSVYIEDQTYRIQLGDVEKKYGRSSKEMKARWKLIHEKDSINLLKVKKILDERGWLGKDIIGEQGNLTLFLVIQHSDLETQIEYLPMIREAAKKKGMSLWAI